MELVLKQVLGGRSRCKLVLVGHSMGGSVAAHLCERLRAEPGNLRVCGLVVMDCVEDTALESLEGAELTILSMPQRFESVNHAIAYTFCSNIVHHLESARVSVPPRLTPCEGGEWKWRTDLLPSKDQWRGWFLGFSDLFLSQPCPKLVCVSNTSVLDRSMIIAQMQGKFEFKYV